VRSAGGALTSSFVTPAVWWRRTLIGEYLPALSLDTPSLRKFVEVSRAFPSWNRSILTEFYLCHACSDQEIEDGNMETPGQGHGWRMPSAATRQIKP
jgi:hypothetical protein